MAKIALLCQGSVGKTMAGPAIRYWELAHALAKKHDVSLLTPNQPDIDSKTISIIPASQAKLDKHTDLILTQTISHQLAWKAKTRGIKIILDAYDPLPLENLELFKDKPLQFRTIKNQRIIDHLNFSFQMADAFICANEPQRTLWTGLLLSLKKITPSQYDLDNSFQKFLKIVPFGLPSAPPQKTGPGLKKMFNLKPTDKVILWGGGIWNWFDPLTLIKAIHQISQHRSDIHLVFMGLKSPDEKSPETQMARNAIQLAKDFALLDKHVFFNYGWIPYEQRANFLLEADIGVSTHFEHLETQFAFRTRILDYIWARLPIVSTTGDSFSQLIQNKHLGLVVPPSNSQALAQALLQLLDHPKQIEQIKRNLHDVSRQFTWDAIVDPLNEMIPMLASTPRNRPTFSDYKAILSSLNRSRGPAAILNELKIKGLSK